MKYLIVSLVFSSLLTVGFSQSTEEVLMYANTQFEAHNFEEARKAYRRVLYFEEEEFNGEAYVNLSLASFQVGKLDES
ncbi:MAG: tetratricopeptide repeat protein, partial [Flavobacteriales bacterium]|nr:tetratricopeptide repeat protein [Flavobacteriales bacterium]